MNVKQVILTIFEKVPFTLVLVVYLAFVGWGFYQFMYDDGGEIHLKQGELTAARDDIRKLEKRVKDVNDFMQTLAAKKQQLRQLAQELENTQVVLAETLDVPDLMNIIYTEARRSGLTVTRLNPSGAKKFEFDEANEFSFQSSGVFFQYLSFLDRLANLRKILRVSDLKLSPISPPSATYVRLTGEMHILAYHYLGTKADELGKASEAGAEQSAKKAASK